MIDSQRSVVILREDKASPSLLGSPMVKPAPKSPLPPPSPSPIPMVATNLNLNRRCAPGFGCEASTILQIEIKERDKAIKR